jgi:large subunit ribosomal protein L18
MANKSRADIRRSVHTRIRKKVRGTTERPRLAVYRSTNHIYAQVIDDVSGKTLAAASTVEKAFKGKAGGNLKAAEEVGKMIADRAKSAGVAEVVYDRGGYVYHGRVKALIDASRAAGLNQNGGGAAAPAKASAEEEAPAEEAPEAKAEEEAKSEEE